jgi:hypothetical protein
MLLFLQLMFFLSFYCTRLGKSRQLTQDASFKRKIPARKKVSLKLGLIERPNFRPSVEEERGCDSHCNLDVVPVRSLMR